MPDGSSLIVDVGLSTAKLERDADRIVAKIGRTGGAIDSAWINATRGIDEGFKKAGASASVFERELKRTGNQVESLRRSVDPLYAATQKLEQQETLLNRALQQGQIDAEAYQTTLLKVRAEFDLAAAAAQRAGQGISSAAESASVFEREIARTDQQVESLRRSVDPLYAATQRLERQQKLLSTAFKRGQIDAKTYDATLSLVRAEFDLASAGARRMAGAIGGIGAASRGGSGGIQNVAFQVGDFATQVGAGTSASIALGQQLPQLLGGFGALGAVLGAVTAIGVPLISYFVRAGTASDELAEDTETLAQAVQNYVSAAEAASLPTEELSARYGTATEAAREFARALSEIEFAGVTDQIDTAIGALVSQLGVFEASVGQTFTGTVQEFHRLTLALSDLRANLAEASSEAERNSIFAQIDELQQAQSAVGAYISTLGSLRSAYNLTAADAALLADATLALAGADGIGQQVEAAQELQRVIELVFGTFEDMPEPIREAYEEAVLLGSQIAEVQGTVEDTTSAAQDLSAAIFLAADGLGAASANASTLLGNLQAAAAAAFELARAQAAAAVAEVRRGPDGAVNDVRERLTPQGLDRDFIVSQVTRAARPSTGGSRGSRGSSGSSSSSGSSGPTLPPLFEDIEGQLEALERQIGLIGATEQEVDQLTAQYELFDEARRRGLDLDEQAANSNRTLREEIEAQAEAYANLAEQLRNGEASFEAFESGVESISNEIADAIVNFESLGDVFRNVLRQMASNLISSGIQSLLTQTFAPLLLGGGGLFGGIAAPSFDGGGFTGTGSRTGGIDGRGGFPAILHPNETVIDHTRGGSASASVSIVNNFDMTGAVGADGVTAMLQSYDQRLQTQLPDQIRNAVQNPRQVRA